MLQSHTITHADTAAFAGLRQRLEVDWVPAMQSLVGVETASLPVLWDADFLLGPGDEDGTDAYVLCEINASCVTPFPPKAPHALVALAFARTTSHHRRT